MRKPAYNEALIKELSTRIMESSVQLMSVDEMERGQFLTEPEFLARAEAFIKHPETRVPGTDEARYFVTGLLAKTYRKGIAADVVKKYTKVLAKPSATKKAATPLTGAAKKRKADQLRKRLGKHR